MVAGPTSGLMGTEMSRQAASDVTRMLLRFELTASRKLDVTGPLD